MQEEQDLTLTDFRAFIHLARASSWRRDEAGIDRAGAKFLSEVEGAVGAASINDDDLGEGRRR